jgi:hypothetical protein
MTSKPTAKLIIINWLEFDLDVHIISTVKLY